MQVLTDSRGDAIRVRDDGSISRSSDGKLLMRPIEVAQALSLSRSRAYEMLANGTIPGVVRLGRSIRVRRADLERWVAGLGKEGTAEVKSAAQGGDL